MKSIATVLLSLFLAAPAHAFLICDGDNTNGVFWYVGQPVDAIHTVGFDTGIECFAIGTELAYVQQHFSGVHLRTGGRVSGIGILWTGDDAQFIADNL